VVPRRLRPVKGMTTLRTVLDDPDNQALDFGPWHLAARSGSEPW